MNAVSKGIAVAAALLCSHAAQAARIVEVTALYKVESVLINCDPVSPFCNDTVWYSYPSGTLSFDLDTMAIDEVLTKSYATSAYNYSITVRKLRSDFIESLEGAYAHNYKLEGQVGDYIGSGKAIGFTSVGNAVPEPSSWIMMILGFGAVGYAVRRKSTSSPKYA